MTDRRIFESSVYRSALDIASLLRQNGWKAYFVGGFTRDMLLGRDPHDIDIGSNAPPEAVSKIFPRCHLVGASFGVATVLHNDFAFEVAALREDRGILDGRHPESVGFTDDPAVDAARRDFTINGMFWDPVKEEILDFYGAGKTCGAGSFGRSGALRSGLRRIICACCAR